MESCPDCHAPDWRLGPAHPGSHRVAGGSGASHRACLHRQDLPSVSTPLHTPSTTGRRGTGAPTPGRQPSAASPRYGSGRCRSAASSGICAPSISWLSVGAIVSAIHQTAQQAQPAVAAILDRSASPVVHADGLGQNGNNGYVDFQHPHRTLLPRLSGQGGGGQALSEVLRMLVSDFYAAYHHYDGPKNGAGPTCCGISTTWWRSTPRTPRWPSGPRQSITSMSRPGTHPQAQRGHQLAWEWLLVSASPSWLTR